jgi:xanthine permease XanP
MPHRADDPPSPATTWFAALQLSAIAAAYIVFPLVLVQEAQLPPSTGAALIALSFLVIGIATALQASRQLGPGYLCVATFTAAYIAPAVAAAKIGGLPLASGMIVFAGCVEVALSYVFRRIRVMFPPEVAGVVVLLVGLTIGDIAVRMLIGLRHGPTPERAWAVLLVTFGAITCLTIWGRGALTRFGVLIGLVIGYVAACALGLVTAADRAAILSAPLVALPSLDHLGLAFDPALALPFAIAALAATTKAAALAGLARKAAGSSAEADMTSTMARGIRADGFGTMLAGVLGTIGVNPSPSAIAVTLNTGLASRRIAWAILALCVFVAILPPLAMAVALLPRSVMAGMLLFTGCLVLVNGMQMITEAPLDSRRSLVVGLGVFGAIVPFAGGELARAFPPALAPIMSSSFILGSSVALLANLALCIFPGCAETAVARLGRRKTTPRNATRLAWRGAQHAPTGRASVGLSMAPSGGPATARGEGRPGQSR